jgi:prolyl-tRNA synthetase
MRTRLFLRTTEFLWQEGHTAHATKDEAVEETLRMLHVYGQFAEEVMAMPVLKGEKTADERFPGAVATYTIEAMMQDGKALQAGTSHFLGQNFSRAQEIKYLSAEGTEEYCWTTSWGVSTRLVGALIMTHSDDDGLICPPRLAPQHVVIIPIHRSEEDQATVLDYCSELAAELRAQSFAGAPLRVHVDTRDIRGGEKSWQYIKQGVPIRLEIGPRDVAGSNVFMGRRDKGPREKETLSRESFVNDAAGILQEIQDTLLQRALDRRTAATQQVESLDEFKALFAKDEDGAFAWCHAADDPSYAPLLKELKVTARCIPLADNDSRGTCIFTGAPDQRKIVFSRAY